jgi:hypothetical protein
MRRFLAEHPEQLDGSAIGNESLALLRVCGNPAPPMQLAVPLENGWRTVFEDSRVGPPLEIAGRW